MSNKGNVDYSKSDLYESGRRRGCMCRNIDCAIQDQVGQGKRGKWFKKTQEMKCSEWENENQFGPISK
jgi:hypothetical protein